MKNLLFLISLLILFFSCKKENINNRLLELEPFELIDINNAFDVFLSEGNNYTIEIVGDEEIIEYVDLKVEKNKLTIVNTRKIGWLTPKNNKIKLYITSLPLKQITADEGCNIQTLSPITSIEFGLVLIGKSNEANLELNVNTFYYWNNFPTGGKLTLSGKTETLKLWNFAIMSVDAKKLTSNYAIVENSSKGDCEVTVLQKLEYKISGEGNIHLYGKPIEIIANSQSSSGRLIQH